ncbi:hypothetical protein HYV86_03430 [Candidatus Woesearchaeota archaeon]|nr:hypothetical protein [Candidatus Woesearchaeota archaeon]
MRMLHYAGLAIALSACGEGAPGSDKVGDSNPKTPFSITESVGRFNNNGSYSFREIDPVYVTLEGQIQSVPFTVDCLSFRGEKSRDVCKAFNGDLGLAGIAVFEDGGEVEQGLQAKEYAQRQFALSQRNIELDSPVKITPENEEILFDLNQWYFTDGQYHCDNRMTGQQVIESEDFARFFLEKILDRALGSGWSISYVANLAKEIADERYPINPNADYAVFSRVPARPQDTSLLIELNTAGTLPPEIVDGRLAEEVLAGCRDDRPVRELRPEPMELIDCLNGNTMGNEWKANRPEVFTPGEEGVIVFAGRHDGYFVDRELLDLNEGLIVELRGIRTGGIGFGIGLGEKTGEGANIGMFLDIPLDPNQMYCGLSVDSNDDRTVPCLNQQVLNDHFTIQFEATPQETIFFANGSEISRSGPLPNLKPSAGLYIDGGETGGSLEFRLCVGRPKTN